MNAFKHLNFLFYVQHNLFQISELSLCKLGIAMKESKFQTFCNMGQKRGWCELTTVLSGILLHGDLIYSFIH